MIAAMLAAGYMRCSGRRQLPGDTWPRQTEEITKCAAELGFSIFEFFQEEAVPGKTEAQGREAFQRMVATVLTNECRTVIVESLDRLAREYRVQEHLIMYLASKGISIIAANTGENVTEAMMGDPMRRALVQIQGIFAELEKNLLIAKLKKARDRKRATGVRVEGRKPYGFRPGEQEIVNLMLDMFLQGKNVTEIAGVLNRAGRKPRTGTFWFPASVRKILRRVNAVPQNDPDLKTAVYTFENDARWAPAI